MAFKSTLFPEFIRRVQVSCAKVIPLTYDNSLSYYEQICAFSTKLNQVIEAVNSENIAFVEFVNMVNEAFDSQWANISAEWSGMFDDYKEELTAEWGEYKDEITIMLTDFSNTFSSQINALDVRVTALEAQPAGGVGETVESGTFYRIGGTESPTPPEYGDYTTGTNCEIFNGYAAEALNGAAGDYSKAEGYFTKAMCNYSHAEGYKTIAAGTSGAAAHAEGSETIATGAAAHAEGSNNRAYGDASHAEGAGNRSTGYGSHCGGLGSTASGDGSFVHGITCEASGNEAVALGAGTIAQGDYQLVIGCNNVPKDTNTRFIIGKGFDSENRANALEIDRVGNIYCNGSTTALNDMIGTLYTTSDYTATFDINVDTTSFSAVGRSNDKQHQTIIKLGCRIYQQITDYNSFHICDIAFPVAPDGFATGQVIACKYIPFYPLNTGQTQAANYMLLAVYNGTGISILLKSDGMNLGSSQWDFSDQLVIDFIQT